MSLPPMLELLGESTSAPVARHGDLGTARAVQSDLEARPVDGAVLRSGDQAAMHQDAGGIEEERRVSARSRAPKNQTRRLRYRELPQNKAQRGAQHDRLPEWEREALPSRGEGAARPSGGVLPVVEPVRIMRACREHELENAHHG
eukprot:scaffold108019_cov28-Tisochrysis_lutea.AAC.4